MVYQVAPDQSFTTGPVNAAGPVVKHPAPAQHVTLAPFGVRGTAPRIQVIDLSSARTRQEVGLAGAALYVIDGTTSTAGIISVAFEPNGELIPMERGALIRGVHFDRIWVSNDASAGNTVTLLASPEDNTPVEFRRGFQDSLVLLPWEGRNYDPYSPGLFRYDNLTDTATAALAPHVFTARQTYTVPAGRVALLVGASVEVLRVAGSSTAGIAQAIVQVDSTGNPQTLIGAAFYQTSTGNGAGAREVFSGHVYLLPGDVVYLITEDSSVGGSCRYRLSARIQEFDAA